MDSFSWIQIFKKRCIERHCVNTFSQVNLSAALESNLKFCFPFGTLGLSLVLEILEGLLKDKDGSVLKDESMLS